MAAHFKTLVVEDSVVLRKEEDPAFRKIFPLSWKFMIDSKLKGMKASQIYEEAIRRGDPVRLMDLLEVEKSLDDSKQDRRRLKEGLRELDLSRSWLDYSIFSFKLFGERSLFEGLRFVFYILVVAVIAGSLYQLGLPMQLSGFLYASEGYALSLVALIAGLSLLAISKSVILLFLNLFAHGGLPEIRFVYRGLYFDISVDQSLIDAHRNSNLKFAYYVASAYAFMLSALYWKQHELPGLSADTWVVLGAIMSFVSLNPKTKGETTRIFGLLFPHWRAKRFLSYLENRALFALFRRGRWLDDESHLLLYAVLCVGWSFSFLYFIATLLAKNSAILQMELQKEAAFQNYSLYVVLAIFSAMILMVVVELWRVLFRNLFFLFRRQILNFLRKRSVRTEKSFDKEKVQKFLSDSPLFQGFPSSVIEAFVNEGQVNVLRSGYPIVLQGNVGKDLFVMLEGEAAVRKQDPTGEIHEVAHINKGAVFGEIALLRNIVRTASVVALTRVRVFVLPKTNFQKIFGSLESAKGLERRIALTGVLGDSSVFAGIPKETLQIMLGYGEFVEFGPDKMIMEQGDAEKDFYILLRGKVEVLRAGGVRIAEIGAGGFFGEMALLENRARSASIRSLEEVVALKLSREAFWRMVDEDLPLAANIQEVSWLRRQAPEH